MIWTKLDKEKIGLPLFVSPNYGGGSCRSVIDYCSGIPELDILLAESGKKLSATALEMGILIYEDILMFILVRGSEAKGHFSISRDRVIEIKSTHNQMLDIRKDPGGNGGELISRFFGIFGAIVAITHDIMKSKKKNKAVLGSLFEIILDSTENGEHERIIIACTEENKETIGRFCNKIIKNSERL